MFALWCEEVLLPTAKVALVNSREVTRGKGEIAAVCVCSTIKNANTKANDPGALKTHHRNHGSPATADLLETVFDNACPTP